MGYEINYAEGEKTGCSSKITVADRIFYVKLFSDKPAKYFSGDQKGMIQKEISKTEFDLWLNILSDNEVQAQEAQKKLVLGRKY